MTGKQNAPEIRFEGFTDPWEQRKLGDVATIVGGGTPSTNNDAYWDGDIDWYSPAELGKQVYADRSVRRITQAGYDSCSATLLPAGKTILFTSRAGIGNTAILRRSACTNQGFQSLVVNDNTDVYFVYSMTDRIKKFAEQKASGSTFLEISGKGLAAGEFAFSSKDEQTAIGSMFKQLDHLITLHQRKYDKLCTVKKSMLDKMFPKPGETEPEIRFEGFADPWEQRKLGDCVGSTYGGGTPSTSHDEYWGGNIPWIQSSNVLENELFRIDIPKAITQDGLSKSAALQVPGNSIAVVTHVGVGKLVYLPFPYATSQDFVSLSELKGDANFLCYAIHRKLQSELHMVQGSAIKGITKEELLGKAIFLPAAEEQKLVGNQMRAIDNLITLHQRKLELLRNIKKSLLDRMFVQ